MWHHLLMVCALVLAEEDVTRNVVLDVNDTGKVETEKRLKNENNQIYASLDNQCSSPLANPENGFFICETPASSCTAKCKTGYRFPHDERELEIKCLKNKWIIPKTEYSDIPSCEPICFPRCENGGVCVGPYRCNCTDNYWGSHCQYENKECSTEPDKVANAQQNCNSQACTIRCLKNYAFPDGFTIANVLCKNGNWVPTNKEWKNVPDCQPICDPHCENDGVCLPSNVCGCPKSFRGSRCQYHKKVCSSDKLGFNGIAKCHDTDNETHECKLSCPKGMRMEQPPAKSYVCRYSNGNFEPNQVPRCLVAPTVNPRNGICVTWDGIHYKTFDDKVYTFESRCKYTLIRETSEGLFNVQIQKICEDSSSCSRSIFINFENEEFVLSTIDGEPQLYDNKAGRPISMPARLRKMDVSQNASVFMASIKSFGLTINWNSDNFVQIKATADLWGRTEGLCGSLDGNRNNDLEKPKFEDAWRVHDGCKEVRPKVADKCGSQEIAREADKFCKELFSDTRYRQCNDSLEFSAACRWDYCGCQQKYRSKCACHTFGVYSEHCPITRVTQRSWSSHRICSRECEDGKVFKSCVLQPQKTCVSETLVTWKKCRSGCYCPEGQVLYEGRCIEPDKCPCFLRNKAFESGATVFEDCNTCTCVNGRWMCTDLLCDATCSAIGDPHYTTFDGKQYDFMGQCSYYLVVGDNYTVEAENSECSDAVAESMGFIDPNQIQSCTKSIIIRTSQTTIELKKDRKVSINGEHVTQLPRMAGSARVRTVSSLFVSVTLDNGLEVLWDGVSSVYVNAPAKLRGRTSGLCGTFTSSQKDDFSTPDGVIEPREVDFANKWKTNVLCPNARYLDEDTCEANPAKQAAAENHCSVLKDALFSTCHGFVNVEPFYENCMYDMCQCEGNVETCLCSILAAYAKKCAERGSMIQWRDKVTECRIDCPFDQKYQVCGSSCTRSCVDISFYPDCKEKCVEGCNCPVGYTLNHDGKCISVSQCPCTNMGIEFSAGYREIRHGTGGLELCTCAGGLWRCHPASSNDTKDYPMAIDPKKQCDSKLHLQITTCEPTEPRTCRNMHSQVHQNSTICQPGCICEPGYILDAPGGSCVLKKDCPCYHGGEIYREGDAIRADCNTCRCSNARWNCTKNACPGICSVWGDSHYTTFDDRHYDFQGACDYVLAKASLSNVESFVVSVKNVACGTTGVTCSKSVTLAVGEGARESITMTRGKTLSSDTVAGFKRIVVRRLGFFVFLDVPDLGIVVQWDESTRVYVRVDPKWKGKIQGLCGDFNDDAQDDFKTPSGGVAEVSVALFGDSWKMNEDCVQPGDEEPNTCAKHPERMAWAMQRCRIMKSELFEPCHSEVSPDDYINKCIYDACGCDTGGDCECLCTAIAVYAHKCNARGINIQWRSQKLCPMQCDLDCSSYTPCMSTCPLETCDNLVTYGNTLHMCETDPCVEGCKPKTCPEGQVYLNSSYSECVPREKCRPVCKIIDGIAYTEGQKIKSDECQNCFCSRGKVLCKGQPCYENDTKGSNIENFHGGGNNTNNVVSIKTSLVGNICEPLAASKVNPDNCQEFFECSEGPNGHQWVLNNCVSDTMFNENLQQCESADNVIEIMPSCLQIDELDENDIGMRSFSEPDKCRPGEHWSDCAIRCTKNCDYFLYSLTKTGVCNKTTDCVPGCVPDDRSECTSGFWKSKLACVDRSECPCKSDNGRPILPGTVVKESSCRTCQCINNFYTCDESDCEETIETMVSLSSTFADKDPQDTLIVPSSSTPPKKCAGNGHYTWLIHNDPSDSRYNASSFASPKITPQSIRLHQSQTSPVWHPVIDNTWQWSEFRLEKPRRIYGIIVGGDAKSNEFVTGYRVLYSEDGKLFSYFKENKKPKVFRGPVSSGQRVRSIFPRPVEARVIRVNPVSWNKKIAMQLEPVGCDDSKEQVNYDSGVAGLALYTDQSIEPVCDDEMGYNSHSLSDQQISVSSSFNQTLPNFRLSSSKVWRPAIDMPDQYVQFDFLESRNITGVETKGGNNTWTTAYKVKYSSDEKNWNPLIDENGEEIEFLGNYDDYSSRVNHFNKPIGARFLRIYPTKWNRHVGLKVEVRGCFIPYPLVNSVPKLLHLKTGCNVCRGISVQNESTCNCNNSLWWDGAECVSKVQCPCIVDGWKYPVGSSFQNGACEECLCALGGVPICQRKACPSCEPGLRSVYNEICSCLCMPCPAGQRVCPTSNTCVDESKWCNGIQDCPDDETQCPVFVDTKIVNEPPMKVKCLSKCPSDFEMVQLNTSTPSDTDFKIDVQESEIKSRILKLKTQLPEKVKEICPKFMCQRNLKAPHDCQSVVCPKGFRSIPDRRKRGCDSGCVPISPAERICSLSGRVLVTFDGLEYKYDVWDHALVMSLTNDTWYIVAQKTCEESGLTCYVSIIVGFEDHEIILQPDMFAMVDGKFYTPDDLRHLGDKNPDLKLARVGNALRLESSKYLFWVILDSNSKVKVGVSEELSGQISGLCGYMDGLMDNDQQITDGNASKSTHEFGDSWKISDIIEYNSQTYSEESRLEALKICSAIEDSSFAACDNRDRYFTSCLENTCICLTQVNATSSDCKCQALESFVSECLAANLNVDLSTWRSTHDCPADCEAPFVHKDCFRNKCEMSCENLNELDPCPAVENQCVSGCFCPDGTIRSGNTCVPASQCRDCICEVLGGSKYISFDRNNLVFNGNCSYMLSRGLQEEKSKFAYDVLLSNGQCGERVCTEVVTVLYNSKFVQIRRSHVGNQLISVIDQKQVDAYPFNNSWVSLQMTPGSDIKLEIPPLQMEITVYKHNFAMILRIPSHTFGGKTQGICGNCDGDSSNDLMLPSNKSAGNTTQFVESWRLKRTHESLRLNQNKCNTSFEQKHCEPSDNDRCLPLLRGSIFMRCHGSIDPMPYYKACQESMCQNSDLCVDFEAYARVCSLAGICIDWRTEDFCPMNCSQNLEYKACSSACPLTCDSLKSQDNKCALGLTEGCFCPEDEVWHHGKCLSKRHCYPCDDHGHVDGDVWKTDKCTNCTCQNQQISCQRTTCTALETICEHNSRPTPVPETKNDCCPKYYCVPKTVNSTECATGNQQPKCGYGQTLKISYDANSCPKFLCEPRKDNCLYSKGNDILKPTIGESWQDEICKKCSCELLDNVPVTTCVTKECIKIDDHPDNKDYVLEMLNSDRECCPKFKRIGCKVHSRTYQVGEWWQTDPCVRIECANDTIVQIKTHKIECQTNCPVGWAYVQPKSGTCCGECRQANESVRKETACAAEVFDFEKTIGLLVEKKGTHGICKNLEPIKGLTECQGHCTSSTHFNNVTWNQDAECKCCQPVDFRTIHVDLTCEDGKRFKKKITVPAICSCESCTSDSKSLFNTDKSDILSDKDDLFVD